MVSDLLNDRLVEVTCVALEAIANLEGVLQTVKDVVGAEDVASLAELKALLLDVGVDALDPVVVLGGIRLIDVVLELDDVGIGDGVGLDGAQHGGRVLVDGANLECAGLGNGRHGEGDNGPHGGGCDGLAREGRKLVNLRQQHQERLKKRSETEKLRLRPA